MIVTFSGGKDSTAMVLRLLEEGRQIDEIVFFDTGWEFPQMYEHIKQVEKYIGRKITRLEPKKPFSYWMFERPVISRKTKEVGRIGNGWPTPLRRWCTREKLNALKKYCRGRQRYIGIAADEQHRVRDNGDSYPLIEWGMTEADCLEYCYQHGFDWDGLYEHFHRVSCFCCPLQRLDSLRALRKHYPDLWKTMLEWGDRLGEGNNIFRDQGRDKSGKRRYVTLRDLDKRFDAEDAEFAGHNNSRKTHL